MATQEHTPTPWTVWKLAPDSDELERSIVTTQSGDIEVTGIVNLDADAAFIVKAANCHDDLVRALEDLLRVDCASEAGVYCNDRAAVQGRARAALAKAQESA